MSENRPSEKSLTGKPASNRHALQRPPEVTAFLESIILLLMPYFLDTAGSIAGARIEILRTLGSYAANSRPSVLLAAQVIAFGMTTLDVLHEARTIAMPVPMRLRYRGNANSLNRAMAQTEKSLQASLGNATPTAPASSTPVHREPACPDAVEAEPVQPATPAPDTEFPASTSQPMAHPATMTAESAAAAVMDVLRSMGLAAPDSPSVPPSPARAKSA